MSKYYTKPFNPLDWPAGPHDNTGDNQLGFSTSDTVQRYVCGTRAISWNGDVFKYGKAGILLVSYQMGAWSHGTGAAVGYEVLGAGSPIGSKKITLTQGSITEDEYAGGYMILFHATGGKAHLIRGNDATTGTTTNFYLERPLPVAVTTSIPMELYVNPWSDIRQGSMAGNMGVVGPPMAIIAAGSYGWFQTRGVAFIAGTSGTGDQYKTSCYWRHDGSIDDLDSIGADPKTDQYAGYRIVGSSDGDGPLIMLQGSY